jgi:two-component system, NtrC family, sensor kinase
MQTLRLGLFTDQTDLIHKFKNTEITILDSLTAAVEILAIDLRHKDLNQYFADSSFQENLILSKKMAYIFCKDQTVPTHFLSLKPIDVWIEAEDISLEHFIQMDADLQQSEQDFVYLNLSAELNSEYENLKSELEKKLSDHKINLIESRQKILDSNNRSESLRKILFALHQESDIARIETLLNELLPACSAATWIKIVEKRNQTEFEIDFKKQLGLFFQSYDLQTSIIYFIKGDQKTFKKTDLELFQKIRDALILNLNRNQNLSDLVLAEKILTEAFETFPHPLAMIDDDYTVIKSNHIFPKNQGSKCYQILFDRTEPCTVCSRGQKFYVEQNSQTSNKKFEVTSNIFSSDFPQKNIWVHTYVDQTQELYLEQRMTQNAKMKDLGLISSSIAHELNNPLGGIISYLQILQMEIDKNSNLQTDLSAMIQTSLKMKKIIEDLLVFSRRPQPQNQNFENLHQIISESLSEHELLFRSENIKIVPSIENKTWTTTLSKSTFKDSVYFIYQFFAERARHIRKTKNNFTGLLEIKLLQDPIKSTLRFVGNFGPLENDYKLKNVQFLAIHKTLIDQGFHVELTELDRTWVEVRVIFPSRN